MDGGGQTGKGGKEEGREAREGVMAQLDDAGLDDQVGFALALVGGAGDRGRHLAVIVEVHYHAVLAQLLLYQYHLLRPLLQPPTPPIKPQRTGTVGTVTLHIDKP